MFVGENSGKLDDKGRVIFPSSLKRQMSESEQSSSFVLKKDVYSKCLLLYPISVWERFTEIMRSKLNPFNKRHAEFLREFYRGTAEISLDSSNRLLIPKRLLDSIDADKDLTFAGQYGFVQIWSTDNYNSVRITEDELADMTSDLMGDELDFFNGG